ncbi:MAG: hypothetical protein P4L53_09410 [Candidatus Obscuribacterales bacterium]|nr:hypothetical protein [Candidatus Obscuribacterales bacterium]
MNELQSSFQGWPSAVWALAVIVIAVLVYRYAISTAAQRFQAKEANAVREQARDALRREDRLKQEERSAATTATNQQQRRADEAQEREARAALLAALREEAKADVAGNARCAEETKRILAEADVYLVKICRYYVVRDEEIDENDEDQEDPQINLGNMKGDISDSYESALTYFAQAQEFVAQGVYLAAKWKAENCLLEARYAADRIANLDSRAWNEIQAAVR